MKLLSRLKKSSALTYLNISGNDLSESQEKFQSLQKFIGRNESCQQLLMNGCMLKDAAMTFIGGGLGQNIALLKLSLQENEMITKDGLSYLCKGLIDNKKESKLVELDLQKCRIMSKSMLPFGKLLASNYKIRVLNLKHNHITDEGAEELLEQVINNEYVTKVNLD